MKNISLIKFIKISLIIFFTLILVNKSYSQINNSGIFFQALARDVYSNPAKDRKIYVQSTIIQGSETGLKVLIEEHQANTDPIGVFNITIGKGVRKGGTVASLASVDWPKGPYYLSLKIAISPVAPLSNWDYSNEWIDLGTTPFGTVPYALYSVTSGGLDEKLNITDTAKMLALYAKAQTVQSLSTAVAQKISTSDTSAMLAPYKAAVNALVASNITSLTATAINNALDSKLNKADSINGYVTPSQLAAKTFDQTPINDAIALRESLSNKSTNLTADANSDLKYPSVKSVKDYVDTQIAGATIPDANASAKGKIQLAGDLTGTAAAPAIASNAVTTSKIVDGAVTDAKIVNISGSKVVGNISGNAATATKIAIPVTINGVNFDGSSNITIASAAANAVTFNNSGSGGISGTSFDGSSAKTISYNTIGASPLAGSNSITTVGTITSGTWNGNTIDIANGGTGAVNASDARTNLGLVIGTDVLAYRTFGSASNNNTSDFESAITAGTNNQYWRGDKTWQTLNTTNVAEGTNLYFNNERARASINLTSTGNSGAATYSATSGTLNIPEYTLSGLGFSLNGLTVGTQSFSTGSNGTDFGISSANGVHTFNIPSASATNRGLLTSTDWTTFNNKASNTDFTSSSAGLVPNPTSSTGRYLKDDGSWSAIPSQVNVDWNAASGVERILNKPDLSLKENVSNKSTAVDLGDASPSDILYPSQKAVKSYVDVSVSNAVSSGAPDATTSAPGKVRLAGDLTGTANSPIVATVGGALASNINTATIAANAATNLNTTGAIVKRDGSGNFSAGTITANLTGNVTGNVNGNATNVTGTVAVANGGSGATSLTGYIKGNGTSAFTASTSIPVADVTGAEASNNKASVTDLGGNGANDTKYPTQLAVKTYVDTKVAAATIADADANTKGKVQLTGDLSGTASSPSVATVGGSTASDINAATVLANAATASNTSSTIVKRDANGDFAARNITASLNGNATNVTGIVLGANGGTGVDNTGKTITLGGNLTTSGAYNTTLTLSGNTNVSLPTSGTITTLTGSEALTNKTINGLTPTALSSGFTIAGGTSTSSTLTVNSDASVSGTNTGDQTITMTGDVTGSGTGSITTTLANTGVVANTYGTTNSIPTITVDSKGRITNVTNTTINAVGSTLSNGTILIGNGSNQADAITISGDVTIDNTGVTSIGANKVTNSMLAGSIDLTSKVNGILPVANGGTGANSFSAGFLKANGTNAFTTVSSIPVANITGAVSRVNGVSPNSNGDVSLTFGRTFTGLFASYNASSGQISTMTSPANSDIYIVAGDPNTADNGRTFVYDGSRWQEISNNQSATDARYVQLTGSTVNGNLVFTGANNKVTVEAAPSGSYDLTNKTYVDNRITAITVADANSSTKGKLQLAGDLGGTASLPTVVSVGGSTASAINNATVAANAATNANTLSTIVKRDASGNFSAGTITANLTGNVTGNVTGNATNVSGTVAVTNGGTGATSLSGYLKGNGTSAFTASAAIPVADITGAEAVANKATATDLGSSSANDTKYPTQLAVKTYVDTKVAAATIADADATTKGKLQLTGDLGGTAASPTVVTVGGSTASNINTATVLANAATNLNTANAIVRRDASGNFSAGTITGSLSGNATNVTGIVLGANGGTGVANSGKTITLGGNLTTSGAFNTTLTTTANTNITLPTSGTIATLTGSEAFTNKTINGLTPTALTTGFTLAGGTSTSTTLTVGNNASVSGTNTGDQTITLTGDVTGSGTGTFTSTLANSGVTAGTYGSATSVPTFSVDAKGRITSVTNTTVSGVSPIGSTLTSANIIVGNSTNLAAAVAVTGDVTISNTGVTAIGASKVTNTMLAGSIDLTNKVTNVLPLANGGTGLSSVGTNGQVLSSNGTAIVWSNPTATVTASTLSGTTLASNVVASSLTSVGTITSGIWSGTAIASNNIANALTGKSYNGITPTTLTSGFTIAGGNTTTATLTVGNNASVSGTNTGDQTIALTGDVTGSGTGTFTSTLANTGVTAGTYGSSSSIPTFTVDAKGRLTAANTVSITAGVSTLNYTSTTSYANGGAINGTSLTLGAADGTNPGLVSTGTQTIAGSKTFSGATTTVNGNLTGGNVATSTIAGFAANINNQTGTTYTLLASDNGKIVILNNASAITLTVPSGLIVGFNCMIVQLGDGQVTIAGSSTTVINRSGFNKTGGKNAIATLISVSTNTFISSGDMSN